MTQATPAVPEMHIGDYLAPSPLPPIDERERERATRYAGRQLVYGDPNQPDEAPLTMDYIVGYRVVGTDGHFTGEEWINDKFQPHPVTARASFTNAFELDVWRLVEGYATLGAFVRALAETDVKLFAPTLPENPEELAVFKSANDLPVLRLFTSQQRLPSDHSNWSRISGMEILTRSGPIEQHDQDKKLQIYINPNSFPGFMLPAHKIAELWAENLYFAEMAQATQPNTLEAPQA
ncbi:hypothetical protein [Lentzea sp. NBRC 102530]|uniref:hypothetical protein n=1 Tax=Lentzea sp. NBRC 102530 TaxID=3032201 RepID=UPI0024A14738|nr:hypothetical protein [Lentzea sp. NBRC 102530]GLY54811.1 hypothetical protein Lesp01_84660 [Lentzea sp. NBRC 102530]